jgi:hypothetical protein
MIEPGILIWLQQSCRNCIGRRRLAGTMAVGLLLLIHEVGCNVECRMQR